MENVTNDDRRTSSGETRTRPGGVDGASVRIVLLSTGYWHARGGGPCEWAQWPVSRSLEEVDFFAEASDAFRAALRQALSKRGDAP